MICSTKIHNAPHNYSPGLGRRISHSPTGLDYAVTRPPQRAQLRPSRVMTGPAPFRQVKRQRFARRTRPTRAGRKQARHVPPCPPHARIHDPERHLHQVRRQRLRSHVAVGRQARRNPRRRAQVVKIGAEVGEVIVVGDGVFGKRRFRPAAPSCESRLRPALSRARTPAYHAPRPDC